MPIAQGGWRVALQGSWRVHLQLGIHLGRRVCLVGLVAKGVLNGRKGTCQAWNAERDRLVLTLDGMAPNVAVRWENVKELPW